MSLRGFSLVELLIALTVSALVCAAVAGVLPAARAAFDATPGAIDLQQRSRLSIDVLLAGLRAAGGLGSALPGGLSLSTAAPVILPLPPAAGSPAAGGFPEVQLLSPVPGGGRGVLDRDQAGSTGALTLSAATSCPQADDVCGFRAGAVAVIVDGYGRYDVFVVAVTSALGSSLVPQSALSAAYKAGSALVEVESSRFGLAAQPDGSSALVRQSSDGATQPIVDGVSRLGFDVWALADAPTLRPDDTQPWTSYGPWAPPEGWVEPSGAWAAGESCAVVRDESGPRTRLSPLGDAGSLVRLTPSQLQDGPWCPGGPGRPGYDADAFRLRRVDLTLRVEVLSSVLRGPAGRLFARAGAASQSPLRWVPDRTVTLSVATRGAR